MSAFDAVIAAGRNLPGVTAGIKYDGTPVLRLGKVFVAGLALHDAEPDTLVIRATFEQRQSMIEEAPGIYYVTPYYRKHPVVLVRLGHLPADALPGLLGMSRALAASPKSLRGGPGHGRIPVRSG